MTALKGFGECHLIFKATGITALTGFVSFLYENFPIFIFLNFELIKAKGKSNQTQP